MISNGEAAVASIYLKNLAFEHLEILFGQVTAGYKVLRIFRELGDDPIDIGDVVVMEMEARERAHHKQMEAVEMEARKQRLKAWRQEINEVQKARDSNPNWGAFQ